MDQTSTDLSFTPSLLPRSDLRQPSGRNIVTASAQPHQMDHLSSRTHPHSIPVSRYLPPIQEQQAPRPFSTEDSYIYGTPPTLFSKNGFPIPSWGVQYPQTQHQYWFDQSPPYHATSQATSGFDGNCPSTADHQRLVHAQEPEYKRCRLVPKVAPVSLGVGAWEIDALAVAKSKKAARHASGHLISSDDRPAYSWTAPGNHTTEPAPPEFSEEYSHKSGAWQQQLSAYPSPPHSLDDNNRRLGYRGPSPRRTSSVFSGGTLTGSPETSRTSVASGRRGSPPTSPTITATTAGFDSRPGSTGPKEPTPTFEQIYNVPRVNLAPRDTERKSILERFPTEIFMRIMVHCGFKKQILLKRCNSNMYDLVRLEAIPWEIKTAVLLHEENYNGENFPKKKRSQGVDSSANQDSDTVCGSDDEGPPPTKVNNGKRSQRKTSSSQKIPSKDNLNDDDIDKFACHMCFKVLPAYYFEGKHLENKTARPIKGQKKRGQESQSDKKVDTRVEYVQVISVNPNCLPEWLIKDRAEVRATDVESYVIEHMKKGVNCDDLRLHYKDITSGTHCIAPVRGVDPFFTASSSATPPTCETYRPVYQVEAANMPGRGADEGAYTYEICIPENAARVKSPMERPQVVPSTRICQPQQWRQQTTSSDASRRIPSALAPQVKDIIALRRFCIPCGAKYGAYRRDDNRKIISKAIPEMGWWVCSCPEVREAGIGRNCPDCGDSVIY